MGHESTALYSGIFERSMDAKKRVAVPSSWLRKDEGEVLFVSPHPSEGYLMVMPEGEFGLWEAKIQDLGLPAAEKRKAVRKFYSEAHRVETDKQGRIVLTEKHCERAGLAGEIIFVGGRSRFEIWSRERHEASDADQTEAYRRVADAIGL